MIPILREFGRVVCFALVKNQANSHSISAAMSPKHFQNTLNDYNSSNASLYLDANTKAISDTFHERVEKYVKKKLPALLNDKREIFSSGCVYTGSAGVGLLLYHIAKHKNDGQEAALTEALQYVDGEARRLRDSPSFLCGAAGPMALGAVISYKLGQPHTPYTQRLEAMLPLALSSSTPDELLYGRVGYLYALLFVNKETKEKIFDDSIISKVIQCIFTSGKQLAEETKISKTPLLYCWHDSYYLGGAHGVAGIMYLLLQAGSLVSEDQLKQLVSPTIDWLLSIRYPSGNLPSSLGSKSDRLVQWCHGAPGFVQLLTLAYKIFQKQEYLVGALQCGEVVWERGLCTKGYSLCHGVAGNAYTFLDLYQITQDPKWLHRACAFAEWCIEEREGTEQHYPDRPASLCEGLAGRLYFLHDILQPDQAKFPAYSL